MLRRIPRIYWWLFGGALLFRLYSALLFRQPGYTDAFYYSNIALSLWEGRGFREDYIWNYLSRPLADNLLNNPGSNYWFPLTSVLIFLGYAVAGGQNFFASQVPNILISSLLPLISYYICTDIFKDERGRRYGIYCALLTIFCSFYAPYFALPDNFAPFALFTALFLVLNYKALRLPPDNKSKADKLMALAGGVAALAYLTRVDGLLLLMATGGAFLLHRYVFRQATGLGGRALFFMTLTFGIALIPWGVHNFIATGQFFPGGGTKTLFWREYNDFFSYTRALDLPYYLNLSQPSPNWGIGQIILSKLGALAENLWIIGRGALFLTPLFFVGMFTRNRSENDISQRTWRRPEFLPFVIYALILYLVMSLAFTFPSTRGSVFHSSGGLLPFIYLLSFVGLDRVIVWLGTLSRPQAANVRRRTYSRLIVIAFAAFAFSFPFVLLSNWNNDYNENKAVGDWLRANAPGATALVPDAPTFYYATKIPCLVIADESLAQNLELARRYGVRYMMLQPNRTLPAFDVLYQNKSAPGYVLQTELGVVQIYRLEL
jgi:hypothetical protein